MLLALFGVALGFYPTLRVLGCFHGVLAVGKPLVLEDVRVLDVREGHIIENALIVVRGDRIVSVGSTGSVEVPEDAERISCRGGVALPGLVDAHMHLLGMRTGDLVKEPLVTPLGVFFARAVRDAEALIDAGFTTVVDAGGLIALHLKYAVEEGSLRGPRIVAAGFPLSQTFGHGDAHYLPVEWVDARTTRKITPLMSLICDGVDDCRKAARYALREGADFIKVMATGGVLSEKDRPEYRQFTLQELEAIVDEARAARRFVHAHAQGKEGIMNALKAGVKVIAHAIYMDDEAAELAREKNAVIVPTLAVVKRILEVGSEVGIPEWGLRKAEEIYKTHLDNVRKAAKLGVKLATGTDYLGGPFPHGENAVEIKLFVDELGLSPAEALKAATLHGAEAAGLGGQAGVLEDGMKADIIVVDGNPLDDVGLLLSRERVKLVIRDGAVVKKLLE